MNPHAPTIFGVSREMVVKDLNRVSLMHSSEDIECVAPFASTERIESFVVLQQLKIMVWSEGQSQLLGCHCHRLSPLGFMIPSAE
ncbi:MAG: hypothetical protein KIS67_21230 [Verrucomicrobiae bacterium]|nr:hypothetical protein [Verrucomicrobiae bacterium]